MAGLATGIISGPEALQRDWVSLAMELQPDVDLRSVYDAYYQVYRRLYESAKEELHALAKLGADTAP
jgi:ribulokinase